MVLMLTMAAEAKSLASRLSRDMLGNIIWVDSVVCMLSLPWSDSRRT